MLIIDLYSCNRTTIKHLLNSNELRLSMKISFWFTGKSTIGISITEFRQFADLKKCLGFLRSMTIQIFI